MVFASKTDASWWTLSVGVPCPAGDLDDSEEDLVNEATQKDRQPDHPVQVGLVLRLPGLVFAVDLAADSAVVVASGVALEETVAAVASEEGSAVAVIEVGMEEEVASDINQTDSVQARHHLKELLLARAEAGVADSAVVGMEVEVGRSAMHRTAVGMAEIVAIVVDASLKTDHPTETVAQVAAIANRSKSVEVDIETAIAKVGMVAVAEMTTPESEISTVTATTIPEANEDTELLVKAQRRMGLSQRVFSVLFAFQFSSLSSPRVSGQLYDGLCFAWWSRTVHFFTLPPSTRVSMQVAYSTSRSLSSTDSKPDILSGSQPSVSTSRQTSTFFFNYVQGRRQQVREVEGDFFSGCFTTSSCSFLMLSTPVFFTPSEPFLRR